MKTNTRMMSTFDSLQALCDWLTEMNVAHPLEQLERMWLTMSQSKDSPHKTWIDYQLEVHRGGVRRNVLKAFRRARAKQGETITAFVTAVQRASLFQLVKSYGMGWDEFCQALADGKFYPPEPKWEVGERP